MSDFKNRLEVEKNELQAKLRKLHDFLNSENFYKLSEANQLLLKKQCFIMNDYFEILIVRLELLG